METTAQPKPAFAIDGDFDLEREVFTMAHLAVDILGYTKVTSLHLDWFKEFLMSDRLVFVAPRNHFKTTCASVIYPIYRMLKNPAIRILLISETFDQSKSLLLEISTHLKHNEAFKREFGRLDLGSETWTKSAITIKSDRMTKDPTVGVGSTLGTIVSKHCNLIIADDMISDKNSVTLAQRNKVKRWFFQSLIPVLEPDGQIVATGTRWHHADLYSELLSVSRFKNWKKIVLKAEYEPGEGETEGRILFPERFSRQKLNELREEMGTAFYNSQMLNDPSGMEGQSFQYDWIKFYVSEPRQLRIYQGIDLAISKSDRGAYFAMVTIGIPPEGEIYVLDVVRERLDFPQQTKMVKRKLNEHRPILCMIENNSYQDALPQWLQADPEAKTFPIEAKATYGEKERRLASLASLFEAGVIRVREDQEHLVDEYLAFPTGSTFDILDALFLAIEASRSQEVEPQIYEFDL